MSRTNENKLKMKDIATISCRMGTVYSTRFE